MHLKKTLAALAMCLALPLGCSSPSAVESEAEAQPVNDALATLEVPEVPREFRAVWIATVANIDWPSEPGLPVAQQKAELLEQFDLFADLNMNAIILQVRPHADALYASRYEPWSYYLTGEQGKAPEPFYDPLAFAIEEAHKRGLELHAWFNPYRADHPAHRGEISDDHIVATHPHLAPEYGSHRWMNPAEEEVKQRSLNVFMDVATRYDVDGIHIDDYFYPYQIRDDEGNIVDFPDADSYAAYQAAGGTLSIADYRRAAVDDFIERFYTQLKEVAPKVRFGISPFGIWKPGYPEQIQGFNQYEGLYADARKWIVEGWVDYYTPQLYWEIAKPQQSFPALLTWWTQQNPKGRNIWPGLGTYKTERQYDDNEIVYQIQWIRHIDGADGHVHFSAKSVINNLGGFQDKARTGVYAKPALVPPSPWLSDGSKPEAPSVRVVGINRHGARLLASGNSLRDMRVWAVQIKRNGVWDYEIYSAKDRSVVMPLPGEPMQGADHGVEAIVAFTVDELGIASDKVILELPE
ncbi:glycoside hydrolase family 10 protein [Mucisphaera sp.]|uniref:glycoside hydrolase family 10 protein n=1 Tax=Mucisphaera sp. TaxID=2913024 RepID=UPI003D0F1791